MFSWTSILSWFPTHACRFGCTCQHHAKSRGWRRNISGVSHQAGADVGPFSLHFACVRRKWAANLTLPRAHTRETGSKWPLMDGGPMCAVDSTERVSCRGFPCDGGAAPIRCPVDAAARTWQCMGGLSVMCCFQKNASWREGGAVSSDVKDRRCDRQATPLFGVWHPENSLESVLIPVNVPTMLGMVHISSMLDIA